MSEIVQVVKATINNEIVPTVNARDLHLDLESKQEFSKWIKDRVEKYDFREWIDFMTILSKSNWRPRNDYILKLDVAKEIAMVENNDKWRELRRYFIEVEKSFKEVRPLTFEEMAKQTIALADKRILALETQIAEDKQATDFGKAISQSAGTVNISDWIKSINDSWDIHIWRNKAFKWFRDNKYITQNNRPMQQYVNQWLMELKEWMIVTDTRTIPTFTTLLTWKWQMYFAKKLKND